MQIYKASSQWFSRPDDERYLSLDALHDAVAARRRLSDQAGVALDHCQLRVDDESNTLALTDPDQGKVNARFNHWSFGQFCSLMKTEGATQFLRSLPSGIAAIPLQYQLEKGERSDAQVLFTEEEDSGNELRAFTSSTYGRIWDEQVTSALLDNVDTDIWKVPSASYASSDPTRATTLYASDRDVFIFLVNEQKSIDIPGSAGVRRGDDHLNRGFIVWNSEVGKASLGMMSFLYEYVCDNRIIWGASSVNELRINHTSGGPHRFVKELIPKLEGYLQSSSNVEQQRINNAAVKQVGKDRSSTIEWLQKRGFSTKLANAAYEQTESDGGDPRSILGVVQGLTAVVRKDGHTDSRVTVEKRAGKLLEYADSAVVA